MNPADQFETLEEIHAAVAVLVKYIGCILEATSKSEETTITKLERKELRARLFMGSNYGLIMARDYLNDAISRRNKKGAGTNNNLYPCPHNMPKLPNRFDATKDIRVSVQCVWESVSSIIQKSVDSKALPASGKLILIRWLTCSIGGISNTVMYLDSLESKGTE